ncbi:MAG TPA: hypothetical protein PKC43_09680 [Phycisphaerales bacterium]|nr:hypothetical protein [Phycisphaerales bacterium]HMP37704.1 hypothetical protein [Phycisphaerales bacterium]
MSSVPVSALAASRRPCLGRRGSAVAALVGSIALLIAAGPDRGCEAGGGTVVAFGDEWLLSDHAFATLPEQAATLALNVAEFLAGPGGSILVCSTNFGLTGSALASAMATAGYGWTVDSSVPISLEALQGFDAVYFAGVEGSGAANAAVLAAYVAAGGGVLVCAGTAAFGSAPAEAEAWNPFLVPQGLEFVGPWFPVEATVPVPLFPGPNPVTFGVSTILWGFGQAVFETSFDNPATSSSLGDFAAWGLFPTGVIGVAGILCGGACPGDLDGNGIVDGADLGILLGVFGESGPLGDLTCDGVVDGADLGILLGAWGPC